MILAGGCATSLGGTAPAAVTTTAPTTTAPTTTTTAPTTTAPTTTAPTTTAPTTTTTAGVPADMLNPAVTPATIATTICVSGYTTTIRPPVSFTDRLKVHQIMTYGYADRQVRDYEEDHVIALEIGGAAAATVNLFPEPHAFSIPDDTLENSLHSGVCTGRLGLAEAQRQMLAAKVAHGYSRAASAA
ncbi:MAG: hypothetical protein QOG44_1238 [Acidimicrobiaceae bacterium]|nr:hypothetical protein [Acidimicrobiaceae bacterium]